LDTFALWHFSHVWQNVHVSFVIVGHQYHRQTYLHVRWSPKCPIISWALVRIVEMSSRIRGTHITSSPCKFFFRSIPPLSLKRGYFSVAPTMNLKSLSSFYPFRIRFSSRRSSSLSSFCKGCAFPLAVFPRLSARVVLSALGTGTSF
jgi:hypothetical protein